MEVRIARGRSRDAAVREAVRLAGIHDKERKMKKVLSVLLALSLVVTVGLAAGTPVQALVSQPQVTVSPVLAGAVAEYTIVFSITASLTAGEHSITVDFPSDTGVPAAYGTGNITINGNAVSGGDVSVVDRAVTLITPVTIVAPATVTVCFIPGANITNPTATGDYKLMVNTSRPADETPVESAAYAIREVPEITAVNPNKGNVGGTMWVVITGDSFMGNPDTNASETTVSFGVGADVLKTKYISVNELNVQIYVKAEGTFAVSAQTPAGSSTTNGSFTANAAGTKQVDRWVKYTPSDSVFTNDTLVFGATYGTIGAAISGAATGHTLLAHAATYQEDFVIDVEGLTLTSVDGKAVTKIKGVATAPRPAGPPVYNIEILAKGAKISGFTIESPDVPAYSFASGLVLDGQDIEIFGNAFVSIGAPDSYCVAIQTWRVDVKGASDVTGLKIYNNTFSSSGIWAYQGVFINRDSANGLVTVSDNVFSGSIHTGIANEGSNAVISGNQLTSSYAGAGIVIMDWDATRALDGVQVTGNSVKGFARGIVIGHGEGTQTLTNISVTRNTVQNNETGVLVRSSAGGVMVNYNNIDGNTEWGVRNTHGDTLNALYNWWGHAIGPNHVIRNPGGQLDAIDGAANFSPWIYKPPEQFAPDAPALAGSVVMDNEATSVVLNGSTSYVGGWNSFSTPIALDSSGNTVSKLLTLAAAGDLFILRAQRFDPATQSWVTLILNNTMIANHTITPGEGFFIQVRDKGSLPILVATATTAPPMRDLVPGWNLIGTSSLSSMNVATALSGLDYSVSLSPKPPNSEMWSVPPSVAEDTYLRLGAAYWVAMSAAGKLFGYTYTPVSPDMTWELNQ
ncbi:MAG: right-handed parallel beta-helix repeat-containing protein [Dehalococcoidia bacterium]|nr:right-handed parallel beta-helix repeat-containing protein [Dehalococcoidia bacterium]